MDPFIGQINLFAGNFAPRGWALCDGQLLEISSNSALFSILGTTYGGDGKRTFRLPDLRGRAPIHAGAGPGLSQRSLGEAAGAEQVALKTEELPAHQHDLRCLAGAGDQATPQGHFAAGTRAGAGEDYAATQDAAMNPQAIAPTGSGSAHDNMPPFLALNYIIALIGLFPGRN